MRGLVMDFGGVLAGPGSGGQLLSGIIADLRGRGVRTAILSNDPGGSAGIALRGFGGGRLVDEVVLSGDVGLAKPDPRIFRLTAHRLGLSPEDCVFVDDLAANVRGAVDAGMVGVRHVDPQTTAGELCILFDLEQSGTGGMN
ncbi:HAD-IA family hydrolase [Rhodococcus spelaei]|uniref:HAD-IA family hydrolase n=1 Tax=Rhodococcus spelaei TaxID=2546320 RepID=A0A541B178_9NOCA|nr:HAD-IA family hydrolase [Rhodococcus spelaei]TQF66070.1 HAD-IA family hydrolase [Rhodococcus spelaei]